MPSSRARAQCREAFRTSGPLTPKCVQSSAPDSRVATAPSIHTDDLAVDGDPRQAVMNAVSGVRVEEQRRQRRRRAARANDPGRGRARSRRRRSRSSAATARRSRARRRRAVSGPRDVSSVKPSPCARDRLRHACRRGAARPRRRGRTAARSARRAPGWSRETACRRLPRAGTRRDRGRRRPSRATRQPAQHAAHDRPLAAPEVGLGDDGVGDVAAAAAADQDLGARLRSRRRARRRRAPGANGARRSPSPGRRRRRRRWRRHRAGKGPCSAVFT